MKEKRTILYVDDEEINLMLFEINFKEKFNVIIADSGSGGLRILEKLPDITIVISDMKMPGMNGIEFIKKAKKLYPNVVYFILTGFEITNEISSALKNKLINDYFKKPFNMREIEASINLSFSKKQ